LRSEPPKSVPVASHTCSSNACSNMQQRRDTDHVMSVRRKSTVTCYVRRPRLAPAAMGALSVASYACHSGSNTRSKIACIATSLI
jgi:hypothetical protein